MTDTTDLGDRMKKYEAATRQILPRRTYAILRVDIRAGRSYLRNAERPFDMDFVEAMNGVASRLCVEVQGAKFAYTQSDEISLLYTDFDKLETQPWFGGVVAKQQSVGASIATSELMYLRPSQGRVRFDARVFTLPDAVEVANYFVWRQRDAIRNSVHMAARAAMSNKQVQGKSSDELVQALIEDPNAWSWDSYPEEVRYGRVIYRTDFGVVAGAARGFKAETGSWLAKHIPEKFSL